MITKNEGGGIVLLQFMLIVNMVATTIYDAQLQHVICNKEKEIATMAEKLNNIERKVDSIDTKLDTFITKADEKYATKEELKSATSGLKEEVKWTKEKIFSIAKDVAITGAILGLILKGQGII